MIGQKKGFWDKADTNKTEKMALMITELAEVVEALRHGNPASEHIPEILAVAEELVDTIIHGRQHNNISLIFTFRILLSKSVW